MNKINFFIFVFIFIVVRILKKRQGAFVLEQIQPRPEYGLKSRHNLSNVTTLWDLMHPDNSKMKEKAAKATENFHQLNDPRNQRRDPIGYFSDMKYGDKMSNNNNNGNKATPEPTTYQPTWNGDGEVDAGNELIDRALIYPNQKQQIAVNDFENS